MEISTADPATGNPVVLASGHPYLPPAAETLRQDEDDNLIEDRRGLCTWDAEPSRGAEARWTQPCASRVTAPAERPNPNRLVGMEEKARAVGGGVDPASLPPRKRLTFAYDARHRRIAK